MPRFIDDEALRLAFAVHQQPGVYALLLGSGLSSAADIPTGWAITIDLIRRVGALRGETAVRTDAEWETWYRAQTGRAPDYSDLLAELGPRPAERQPIIASYIEPTEADRAAERKLPTEAHKAIARLVAGGYVRVILTTNFDRLLENALRDAGVEPVVIASPDQCNGAKPLQHVPAGSCTIIKLHGDYLDVRSLNTAEELATYDAGMERLLARIFDEYGLVICGWSGIWDTALRNAMFRAPGRRYSTWWASLGPLAEQAQDLAYHRDAQSITIDGADGFFTRLADQVELIEQTRRPPPASMELLIAAAKRNLLKPEPQIDLFDLLDAETERAVAVSGRTAVPAPHGSDISPLRHQVERYEAAFQPLASVAGVVGRWGNEAADQAILSVIRHLYSARPSSGQETDDHRIKTYPALLVSTAYALGLIAGQRWAGLWRLLQAQVPQPHDSSRPVIECLYLNAWEGQDKAYWQSLEPKQQKTLIPLTVRLWGLLAPWARLFIGQTTSFCTIMGKFELLGAIATCKDKTREVLEADLALTPQQSRIWFPVGKIGWDDRLKADLMAELVKEVTVWPGPNIDQHWLEVFSGVFDRHARAWGRIF